jgi:hypothetical protein
MDVSDFFLEVNTCVAMKRKIMSGKECLTPTKITGESDLRERSVTSFINTE